MSKSKNREGVTRRNFIRTVGIGGAAAAVANAGSVAVAAGGSKGGAPSVPLRKFGKTGVEVSSLCLGGAFDTVNNQLLLKQAHNWGVRLWDTAELYGNGQSEEGYGRFFSRNPEARKDIFLVTKLKPAAPEKLSEGLDKCLKRLNTDHVDVFMIQAIGSVEEIGEPIKEWAYQMKKAGKIKYFGFATHTNMEDCLLGASKRDWIDAIMFSYNFRLMHTPKMKDAVTACANAGIGLIAMKTQGGGQVQIDSEAELQIAGRFLERGFTDKQVKLKAVWENPNIVSVCSQMPTLTILSANVAAARDLTKLSRSDFDLLEKFASETCSGYCAGCGSVCLKAVDGAVPVSDVMRCIMYYRDYGERDLARETYAGVIRGNGARLSEIDFSKAEKVCPNRLPIARLMSEASRLLG